MVLFHKPRSFEPVDAGRSSLGCPPTRQHAVDLAADATAGVPALDAQRQELVVTSLRVTHVRLDRQADRLLVEPLGCRRSPDPPAVLLTRVRRDPVRPIGRAVWIELANALGNTCHEFRVQFGAPIGLPLAAPSPCLGIVQALGFGTLKRRFLDEQSLSLVPLARAAPFQHHGRKCGVLAGAPSERRVAGREEREMVEIAAREAQRAAIACEKDPRSPPKILATVVATRLPVRNEDAQVAGGAGRRQVQRT